MSSNHTDGNGCRWLAGEKSIAAYLDVDPRTVRRYRTRFPGFPAILQDGCLRANTCQLDRWIHATRELVCPTCGTTLGKGADKR